LTNLLLSFLKNNNRAFHCELKMNQNEEEEKK